MMLLAHIDLVVRDLERSLAFYVGCLGCTIELDTVIHGPSAEFYARGGATSARIVMLRPPADGAAVGGMIELVQLIGERPPAEADDTRPASAGPYGIRNLTLAVASLADTLGGLRGKGVVPWRDAVVDVPGLGRIAFVADPDGTWIELVEPPLHKPAAARVEPATIAPTYPDTCIHELFERRAAAAPERIAVVFDGQTLTYGELEARANQLARQLQALGVGPETLVGVAMERSLELVVSLLAVLKAGAAYVPFDPSYPRDRLAYLIADARPRIVLVQERLRSALPFGDEHVLAVDAAWPEIARQSPARLGVAMHADQLAYVIYTSGSTGRPKGVQVSHRNVTRLFHATNDWYRFDEHDVWTLFHSYAFDFSVWEIWGALVYGGRLVVVPHLISRAPDEFRALLAEQRVTVLNQTPSAFYQLIEADRRSTAALSLRLVIFGGEALAFHKLEPWFRRHGDRAPELVNMYGITETTVHVTYRAIAGAEARVGASSAIGQAIPDLQLFVLDRDLAPVAAGVEGELYVGGAGLARGYLNRPGLTAERFVPNPFGEGRLYKTGDLARRLPDGSLDYLGRNDHQVKIRGFRIELGEIEAQLATHPAVREVVVLAREDASGDKLLVAYVVSRGEAPAADELRAHVEPKLPDYMVPSAYVALAAMPLTAHGKIDRDALPMPGRGARTARIDTSEAPTGAIESTLAQIWCELLGVDSVRRSDNFFGLGGHSLVAMRLMSRVREQLGIELSLSTLYATATLGELSVQLARSAPAALGAPTPRAERVGSFPVLPPQHRMWLADQMGVPNFDVEALGLHGPLEIDALRAALDHVARVHPAFATTFALEGGHLVQRIGAPADAGLEVVDLSTEPRERAELELAEIEQGEAAFVCDPDAGPLHRFVLCRMSEREHVLFVGFHHLVMDGWSMQVFLTDFEHAYNAARRGAPPQLVAPPIDCADLARWRTSAAGLPGSHVVRELVDSLRDAPQLLTLRCARPRPAVQDYEGSSVPIDLDPVIAGVRRRARELDVTATALLLSAFGLLLQRESGANDLVVGVPVANRGRLELERVIGCVMDVVPLRLRVDGDASVDTIARTVNAALLHAPELGVVSLDQILDEVSPGRATSHDPLFQVMFVNETGWDSPISLVDLECRRRQVYNTAARLDLLLSIHDRPTGAGGHLEYRTSLFTRAEAERLAVAFVALVAAVRS